MCIMPGLRVQREIVGKEGTVGHEGETSLQWRSTFARLLVKEETAALGDWHVVASIFDILCCESAYNASLTGTII